jgi:hypothetical protein
VGASGPTFFNKEPGRAGGGVAREAEVGLTTLSGKSRDVLDPGKEIGVDQSCQRESMIDGWGSATAAAVRQDDAVRELSVNLLASIVAGVAVWIAQRLLRYRRLARKRAFFGLDKDADCLLTVSRHAASPHSLSVHRRDGAALIELAAIARDCGARPEFVGEDEVPRGIGRLTEFCVGGPDGNPRTAAHLRSILRGVRMGPFEPAGRDLPFTIGDRTFHREPDKAEHVFLARAWGPAGGRPVFVLGGQTARTNLAAARFLATDYQKLMRRYGAKRPFCLVLRIVEPEVYGTDFTEFVADMSDEAFQPRQLDAVAQPAADGGE